jgi:hypothetical protein
LYEERGRGFLAMRGQMTRLQPGKKQIIANAAQRRRPQGFFPQM